MKILDKAKAAAEQAASRAKEGVEEVQTKRDLRAAQAELGEKTFALVEAGELDRPELADLVARIRALEAKLAEEDDAPAAETPTQPPAMPT
jgi:hypothetical protein